MADRSVTPVQAADKLFASIPHAISRATLEEYGLEATASQATAVTREMLSLSLFWIGCALRVSFPERATQRIVEELHACIRRHWHDELDLDKGNPEALDHYFHELDKRRATYQALMEEGGEPMALASETAAQLHLSGAVDSTERANVIALIIDLMPIDDIGAAIGAIDSVVE